MVDWRRTLIRWIAFHLGVGVWFDEPRAEPIRTEVVPLEHDEFVRQTTDVSVCARPVLLDVEDFALVVWPRPDRRYRVWVSA